MGVARPCFICPVRHSLVREVVCDAPLQSTAICPCRWSSTRTSPSSKRPRRQNVTQENVQDACCWGSSIQCTSESSSQEGTGKEVGYQEAAAIGCRGADAEDSQQAG